MSWNRGCATTPERARVADGFKRTGDTLKPTSLSGRRKARGPRSSPTVVDLFCGAGGLSLGFQQAGFEVVRSVDHNPSAVSTYARNLGGHIEDTEITEDIDLPSSTVIAGGPPCQGFSSAGLRRDGDRRNTLVTVFAAIVARHRPSAFVFENVEGFLTGEGGARVLDLLTPLISVGYCIHLRKVNAANYGVPQHRKRVIAVGGLGWEPSFPEPTHSADGAPGAALAARNLPRAPGVIDGFRRLPKPAESAPGGPNGHFAPPLDDSELRRIMGLKQGDTMRDLPPELWHESFSRRAYRRVMDGTPSERRGGAPCGIRRLRGDEPSKAITSFARNEFVHPIEHRFLTIRECARLQTFSDDFEFSGSVADQALLIGNAVPPTFGAAIARQLASDLSKTIKPTSSQGRLLSFVPTMSTGMSPALRKTTDAVRRAFGTPAAEEQLQLWA